MAGIAALSQGWRCSPLPTCSPTSERAGVAGPGVQIVAWESGYFCLGPSLGLSFPLSKEAPGHRRVRVGRRGEKGEASDHPGRASAPGERGAARSAPPRPFPTPTAENSRGQLAGRLWLNPQQVTSKAAELVRGRGGEQGPYSRPTHPASPLRLFRKPVVARCPSRAPCLSYSRFPHMTLGETGPHSHEGGALGSLTHRPEAWRLLSRSAFPWGPGGRMEHFGGDTGRWAGAAREGEGLSSPLVRA